MSTQTKHVISLATIALLLVAVVILGVKAKGGDNACKEFVAASDKALSLTTDGLNVAASSLQISTKAIRAAGAKDATTLRALADQINENTDRSALIIAEADAHAAVYAASRSACVGD